MGKPLSKVHVSKNGLNTDFDPQDILLHCRMVNKIGYTENRQHFICNRVSQNRYQYPGEKNRCQPSTNDQEKDEQRFTKTIKKDKKRFTKTGTHDHQSPCELECQSEPQRMLHKCNLCRTPNRNYIIIY